MRRNRSVSVTIFKGMRFNMSNFNGRMSCVEARKSSMTNIFSAFNISTAGNDEGILRAYFVIILIEQNYKKMNGSENLS